MTKNYTLKQLEGLVKCELCGCKYWKNDDTRIACRDCGLCPPSKPVTTKSQVKSDFQYARMIMSLATKELAKTRGNDDPRLGSDIDLKALASLANDLAGAAATLSQYVADRGGCSVMTNLNRGDKRGTLTYLRADFDTETVVGTFRIQGERSVIARRKHGRNRWLLCSLDSVIYFNEGEGWS